MGKAVTLASVGVKELLFANAFAFVLAGFALATFGAPNSSAGARNSDAEFTAFDVILERNSVTHALAEVLVPDKVHWAVLLVACTLALLTVPVVRVIDASLRGANIATVVVVSGVPGVKFAVYGSWCFENAYAITSDFIEVHCEGISIKFDTSCCAIDGVL